jgi:hypothetical protein
MKTLEHDQQVLHSSKIAQRRIKRLAAGLCQDCGSKKIDKKRPTCDRCLGLRREAQRRKATRRIGLHRCVTCNELLPKGRTATICVSCTNKIAERARLRRKEIKEGVIKIFGGACKRCGESDPRTLTIHHVNGDGGQHKEEIAKEGSIALWRHIYRTWQDGKSTGYELELLCYNCHAKIDLAPWWTVNKNE